MTVGSYRGSSEPDRVYRSSVYNYRTETSCWWRPASRSVRCKKPREN